MEDFSSGKVPVSNTPDYHNTFDGPRLPQHDRQPTSQPPSHLEVSLHTQHLLLQHIAEDRREKEHLAAKLNSINNRMKVVHMITAENKKRLWKLLRKFFSKKQLLNSNLKELYEYIDQGFSNENFQDCITPPLTARQPTTVLLRFQLHKLLDES